MICLQSVKKKDKDKTMKDRIYKVFGLETGKIYAQGTEEYVHRHLQAKFPSFSQIRDNRGQVARRCISPEPMAKTRII